MSKLAVHVSAKDHTAGPDTAPVTLVEYGDYQCPSCGQAFPIVQRLQKHFGDKLRFVFRNFPLPMHPYAEHAAEAAEFAAAHDKFWPMHDLLYKHQANLADEHLLKLATELDLSADALAKALKEGTYKSRVKADLESGENSGVTGTPMFYINGELYEDSYDFQTLADTIDSAMPA
jgi:protein-disulfide isomerase